MYSVYLELYSLNILQIHPFLTNYSQRTWRQIDDNLPVGMTLPQCVVIDSQLYVGGGNTNNYKRELVFVYNSYQQEWSTLPPTPQIFFGLTSIHGKVVVIGGVLYQTKKVTGQIVTYDKETEKWIQSIPPMPTPRYRACAISNNSTTIAVGGLNSDHECLNTVEILVHNTNRWHSGIPLPAPRAALQCTVIDKRVYFMAGCYPSLNASHSMNTCYYTDYLASENLTENTPVIWETLPDLPLSGCAPASMCGVLLAIGGDGDLNGVHFFDPRAQLWLRIGNIPQYRVVVGVATLRNGQIIFIGGRDRDRKRKGNTFVLENKQVLETAI